MASPSIRSSYACLAAAALLLCSYAPVSADFTQQDSPLRGQGVPGPTVSQGIYMSAFLDRLLAVDEQNYRFDAVLYFYISWVSKNDTARWFQNNIGRNCADPSRADYATYCGDIIQLCTAFRNLTKGTNATVIAETDALLSAEVGIPVAATCESFTADYQPLKTDCARLCSNQYETQECCDDIFIPDFQLSNIYESSQDYIHYFTITPQYDPKKQDFGAWMWTSQLHAEFYTPLDFRKFPWDTQHLLVEIKYVHDKEDLNTTSVLMPSAAGVLNLRPEIKGDDSSGWRVDSVRLEPFSPADPIKQLRGDLVPPNVMDPVPLFATRTEADGQRVVSGLEPVFNSRLNPGNNLLIRITVSRYSRYYIVNVLVPIILSTLLGFSVFLIQFDDIEKRLGLIVTLFLALTAVQFVISAELPDSSYILKSQALVLTGYSFFLAIALEAWLVCHIASLHERTTRLQRQSSAYRKHWKRKAAAAVAVAKADLLPQTLQHRRSPLGRPSAAQLKHSPGSAYGGSDAGDCKAGSEDLESPASPPKLSQRSVSAPLPPLNGGDANGDISGSGSGGEDGVGGRDAAGAAAAHHRRRPRRYARQQYARVRWVLRPAKSDPDYADWLAHVVDRWACIFLLSAYIIVMIVILAV